MHERETPREPETGHPNISDLGVEHGKPYPLKARALGQMAMVFCPQTRQTLALTQSNHGYERAVDAHASQQGQRSPNPVASYHWQLVNTVGKR